MIFDSFLRKVLFTEIFSHAQFYYSRRCDDLNLDFTNTPIDNEYSLFFNFAAFRIVHEKNFRFIVV